jgi:hypothetical protein
MNYTTGPDKKHFKNAGALYHNLDPKTIPKSIMKKLINVKSIQEDKNISLFT